MYLCSCCLYSHHHCLLSHPSPAAHHPISLHDALPIFTARRMEYTPSNLLRRVTTPGQGYSEFHYGIDRQRVIRRDGNQARSEEHTSELQSRGHLVCRLLLENKKQYTNREATASTKKEE